VIRVGLGSVFVVGGLSKLSQLLHPDKVDGILALYMSAKGYINPFFIDYLFDGSLGNILTPWGFLTALSTFELLSGLALLAGFLVRPLALTYGFLLWTFVIALPVVSAAGVNPGDVATHTAPATLVQIRDIGLSGLMFVLFAVGAGRYSMDKRLFGDNSTATHIDWEVYGLLTRLSVALPLLVGGFFAAMPNIKSFEAAPVVLVAVGLALVFALGTRLAGVVTLAIVGSYVLQLINLDATPLANLNGFKREIAFLAAAGILSYYGGGQLYGAADFWNRIKTGLSALRTSSPSDPSRVSGPASTVG
jgi:uncharacterized membrane protein YphA (DoxX/SURF4 family)